MIRSFGNFALITAITFCLQACSNSFVPPMPPAIDPDIYSDAAQLNPDIEAGQFAYSIVGVRLAERGFYIDMLVEGPAEELESAAAIVGTSLDHDTSQLVEIQLLDLKGKNVPLLRVSFPSREFNWWPTWRIRRDPMLQFTAPSYPFPGASDDSAVIQVLMRKTSRQYKPGSYKIRLAESWQERHDPDTPPSLVDTAWRKVEIDWTE